MYFLCNDKTKEEKNNKNSNQDPPYYEKNKIYFYLCIPVTER